jgi:hypothetical protein
MLSRLADLYPDAVQTIQQIWMMTAVIQMASAGIRQIQGQVSQGICCIVSSSEERHHF